MCTEEREGFTRDNKLGGGEEQGSKVGVLPRLYMTGLMPKRDP